MRSSPSRSPKAGPGRCNARCRRRVGKWIAYLAYLALALVAIDYLFYFVYVRRLSSLDVRPKQLEAAFKWGKGSPRDAASVVDAATMRRLGFLTQDKESGFHRFPAQPPPGAVRVCAFGDSFTRGDEADRRHDYPSLLRSRLRLEGYDQAEVLNFGVDWHGFHQTHLMWDAFAADYGCDVVLLGPMGFQPDRDTTFHHSGEAAAYYFHARYVMDDGDVRLVEVTGDTLEQRFRHYNRFLPRWRYLRYDTRPPAFLRALLRPGRTVANPFYYWPGDSRDEAHQTYSILLSRMVAAGKPVVLGHYGAAVVETGRSVGHPDLHVLQVRENLSFLYRAPRNHNGPMGNDLVAEHYAAVLLPDHPGTLTLLQADGLVEAAPRDRPPVPLSSCHRLQVDLEGVAVAHLAGGRLPDREGSPERVATIGSGALVAVRNLNGGVLDGCFLPVPSPLEADAAVTVATAARDGTEVRRQIGRIRLLGGHPDLGLLDLPGLHFTGPRDLGEEISLAGFEIEGGDRVIVSAGGTELLEGRARPGQARVILAPAGADYLVLRANSNGYLPVAELPDEGVFSITLAGSDGLVMRIPVERWRKVEVALEGTPRVDVGF